MSAPAPTSDVLVAGLRSIVGESHVITDAALMEQYVVDWSRRFGGPAQAGVRPASTDEMAGVLRSCSGAGVPVIVQGGNTGLVGGSVPARDGVAPVVVSTRRLD